MGCGLLLWAGQGLVTGAVVALVVGQRILPSRGTRGTVVFCVYGCFHAVYWGWHSIKQRSSGASIFGSSGGVMLCVRGVVVSDVGWFRFRSYAVGCLHASIQSVSALRSGVEMCICRKACTWCARKSRQTCQPLRRSDAPVTSMQQHCLQGQGCPCDITLCCVPFTDARCLQACGVCCSRCRERVRGWVTAMGCPSTLCKVCGLCMLAARELLECCRLAVGPGIVPYVVVACVWSLVGALCWFLCCWCYARDRQIQQVLALHDIRSHCDSLPVHSQVNPSCSLKLKHRPTL